MERRGFLASVFGGLAALCAGVWPTKASAGFGVCLRRGQVLKKWRVFRQMTTAVSGTMTQQSVKVRLELALPPSPEDAQSLADFAKQFKPSGELTAMAITSYIQEPVLEVMWRANGRPVFYLQG